MRVMVGSSKSDSYWRSAVAPKGNFSRTWEAKRPIQLGKAGHTYNNRKDSENMPVCQCLGHWPEPEEAFFRLRLRLAKARISRYDNANMIGTYADSELGKLVMYKHDSPH